LSDDTERARKYFDRLAPEYDRAFRRQGGTLLNTLVNRAFRSATFERRMRLLESLFSERDLAGKRVLDLGCGSGQVSLLAASLGARVHAIDISPRMLEIARESAIRTGVSESIRLERGDVAIAPLPEADVALLIGVIEYYRSYAELIRRVAAVTREAVIVAHANRVLYRMLLRRLLFWIEGSSLYFHRLEHVIAAAESAGLQLSHRLSDRAFTILVFEPGA
jgi:2-polyprenyl-3-methyl-5-hydroxy-6-metoxy-1,4-benzoquinol methylase